MRISINICVKEFRKLYSLLKKVPRTFCSSKGFRIEKNVEKHCSRLSRDSRMEAKGKAKIKLNTFSKEGGLKKY